MAIVPAAPAVNALAAGVATAVDRALMALPVGVPAPSAYFAHLTFSVVALVRVMVTVVPPMLETAGCDVNATKIKEYEES